MPIEIIIKLKKGAKFDKNNIGYYENFMVTNSVCWNKYAFNDP